MTKFFLTTFLALLVCALIDKKLRPLWLLLAVVIGGFGVPFVFRAIVPLGA
jgi:hypothetical protein